MNINRSLGIFHKNVQHLQSQIDLLKVALQDVETDILVLTEHNMKALEIIKVSLNNFQVKLFYTRQSTTGGGVLIMSKPELIANEKCIP